MCSEDDLAKLKLFLHKTDVHESCIRERNNTKWRLYKLTNLTVFAALLENVPMGCCLKYEEITRQLYHDNLCFFSAFPLNFHGNRQLEEEISKIFNSFTNKMSELSPNQFMRVHMNNIPFVEDLLTLNVLLHEEKIVDGNIIGELAGQNEQKYETIVTLLKNKSYLCYVSNTSAVFQSFGCSNLDILFRKHSNWSDV